MMITARTRQAFLLYILKRYINTCICNSQIESDSSSSCDESDENISDQVSSRPTRSHGLGAAINGSNSSKSPSKYQFYARDRRKQSSILPRGVTYAGETLSYDRKSMYDNFMKPMKVQRPLKRRLDGVFYQWKRRRK